MKNSLCDRKRGRGMDIIVFTIGVAIGVAIGLIIGLLLWQKQISDSITKFDIEIAKLQTELEVYKDKENEDKE
jgi:uncharacterized membrane-anchored protein YhcB (DUF1043 family)